MTKKKAAIDTTIALWWWMENLVRTIRTVVQTVRGQRPNGHKAGAGWEVQRREYQHYCIHYHRRKLTDHNFSAEQRQTHPIFRHDVSVVGDTESRQLCSRIMTFWERTPKPRPVKLFLGTLIWREITFEVFGNS